MPDDTKHLEKVQRYVKSESPTRTRYRSVCCDAQVCGGEGQHAQCEACLQVTRIYALPR